MNEAHMRLPNDRTAFTPVHSRIRAIGPRVLHLTKGRAQEARSLHGPEPLLYLNRLVLETEDPRQRGKGLTANLTGLWRYRVGDYRVICDIQDGELVVLVLQVSHRSQAYR